MCDDQHEMASADATLRVASNDKGVSSRSCAWGFVPRLVVAMCIILMASTTVVLVSDCKPHPTGSRNAARNDEQVVQQPHPVDLIQVIGTDSLRATGNSSTNVTDDGGDKVDFRSTNSAAALWFGVMFFIFIIVTIPLCHCVEKQRMQIERLQGELTLMQVDDTRDHVVLHLPGPLSRVPRPSQDVRAIIRVHGIPPSYDACVVNMPTASATPVGPAPPDYVFAITSDLTNATGLPLVAGAEAAAEAAAAEASSLPSSSGTTLPRPPHDVALLHAITTAASRTTDESRTAANSRLQITAAVSRNSMAEHTRIGSARRGPRATRPRDLSSPPLLGQILRLAAANSRGLEGPSRSRFSSLSLD